MNRMKEPTEVIITQVKGKKPREPFAVENKSRLVPKGAHQRVEVSTVTSLTPPVDEVLYLQTKAFITIEGGEGRYRLDKTSPTTSTGHLIKAGNVITLDSRKEIEGFRIIKIGAENVIMQVSYKGIAVE